MTDVLIYSTHSKATCSRFIVAAANRNLLVVFCKNSSHARNSCIRSHSWSNMIMVPAEIFVERDSRTNKVDEYKSASRWITNRSWAGKIKSGNVSLNQPGHRET